MPDAAILARASHRNISHRSHDDITVVLVPAHNRGPQVAACAGYRINLHPCGYETVFGGWHLHTSRTFAEALDFVRECEVIRHV